VTVPFSFCFVLSREDALLLLQRPLSQQLELLHLWHAAMSTYLATFLQQFREAGGRVMLAAGTSSGLQNI
jgi:hypothetical protein